MNEFFDIQYNFSGVLVSYCIDLYNDLRLLRHLRQCQNLNGNH
jgi:hypothetical protein